jgi:hypothetical protein
MRDLAATYATGHKARTGQAPALGFTLVDGAVTLTADFLAIVFEGEPEARSALKSAHNTFLEALGDRDVTSHGTAHGGKVTVGRAVMGFWSVMTVPFNVNWSILSVRHCCECPKGVCGSALSGKTVGR